jgi:hypothetical protein
MFAHATLTHTPFFLAVTLALGAASGVACSSSVPSEWPDASVPSDANVSDASSPDSERPIPPDANVVPDASSAVLPACLGASRAMRGAEGMPYVDATLGSAPDVGTGAFLLDFASTTSTVDLAVFGAPKPVASNCDPSLLGALCTFAALDFFGNVGSVNLFTADHSFVRAGVRQAGIFGTERLRAHVYTIDHAGKTVRQANKESFCKDTELAASGFVALSTTGYYANAFSDLRPLTELDSAAGAGIRVPNVPTVPIRIAGTSGLAQLDTGFDDAVTPYSINVNQAYFDRIRATAPNALARDAARDVTLSTCAGVSEPVEAYRLAAGSSAELVATDGRAVHPRADAIVFVKRTPVAAYRCGGIGTFTVPAAQVGASFFVAAKTSVFDPFSARVWMR